MPVPVPPVEGDRRQGRGPLDTLLSQMLAASRADAAYSRELPEQRALRAQVQVRDATEFSLDS